MKKLEYIVRFNTPAFLGDAEQNGRWRTPPFKALLRQWWRVVNGNTDVAKLREEEGHLFGAANDKAGSSQKSQVRIRLDSWSMGRLGSLWGEDPRVFHPEVGQNGRNVGSHLYLGYGPLVYEGGHGTKLKNSTAIQAGETQVLRLTWPEHVQSIKDTLRLMQWFGTLGGRSRNGWGSLELLPAPLEEGQAEDAALAALSPDSPLLERITRPLAECLRHDWPHALGASADGRVLVWESSQTFADDDWRAAMQLLAKAKIGFRTHLVFTQGETPRRTNPEDIPFNDRHLLAYPVTHHAVAAWSEEFAPGRLKYDRQGWVVQSARLANQLRFKIARGTDGRLVARIYHLPCALPHELAYQLGPQAPTLQQQAAIWERVHAWLDNTAASGFKRLQRSSE